jgi:hypothetical protein
MADAIGFMRVKEQHLVWVRDDSPAADVFDEDPGSREHDRVRGCLLFAADLQR